MSNRVEVVAGTGSAVKRHPSPWPARMDFWQSLTGLFLALFMLTHMFFESSILLGKDAMWVVSKMFEGYFIFDAPHPVLVSGMVAMVLTLLVAHAFLAMRKFPSDYRQYRAFTGHMARLKHRGTTLWWVQLVTGFLMFFLVSAHLYQMLSNPADIGPHVSAARVYHSWWPLYLLLLFCVGLHGGIGLYRLAMKWGWFEGRDPDAGRTRLATLLSWLTVLFLALGLLTLAAYLKIGWEQRDAPGVRYLPAWVEDAGTQGE
jgi:fumarate reductase subunit C